MKRAIWSKINMEQLKKRYNSSIGIEKPFADPSVIN